MKKADFILSEGAYDWRIVYFSQLEIFIPKYDDKEPTRKQLLLNQYHLRMMYADMYEEDGDSRSAAAIRWLAKNHKHPSYYSSLEDWDWWVYSGHKYADLPLSLFLKIVADERRGVDSDLARQDWIAVEKNCFKSFTSIRLAEEELYRIFSPELVEKM